jgi:ferric-dicitrate binding protein FerR (iron transport regulator)
MKKAAISLFILALTVLPLPAQTQSSAARLVIRSGLVEVQRSNVWRPISIGEWVNPGESIRTASGSMAALEVGPGKVVTLNEVSQVQVGVSNSAAIVQLDTGSMKVFAASDGRDNRENILVAAKDILLESAERPLDMELGYQGDKLNLTIFNGAVRNGPMTIRGGNQDTTVRTHTTGRTNERQVIVPNASFYVYPYFLYGYPDPNAGKIVPPVVNNPTNPGYRPTQIVPPMSDPIRVPVTK